MLLFVDYMINVFKNYSIKRTRAKIHSSPLCDRQSLICHVNRGMTFSTYK